MPSVTLYAEDQSKSLEWLMLVMELTMYTRLQGDSSRGALRSLNYRPRFLLGWTRLVLRATVCNLNSRCPSACSKQPARSHAVLIAVDVRRKAEASTQYFVSGTALQRRSSSFSRLHPSETRSSVPSCECGFSVHDQDQENMGRACDCLHRA